MIDNCEETALLNMFLNQISTITVMYLLNYTPSWWTFVHHGKALMKNVMVPCFGDEVKRWFALLAFSKCYFTLASTTAVRQGK